MKNVKILVFIIILSSCAIKRQTKDSSSLKLTDRMQDTVDSTSLFYLTERQKHIRNDIGLISDSYLYRFWPRGNIVFGRDGSVSGNFDSIYLAGQNSKLNKNSKESNLQLATQDKMNYRHKKEGKLSVSKKESQQTSKGYAWKLPVILIVLAVAIPLIIRLILRRMNQKYTIF